MATLNVVTRQEDGLTQHQDCEGSHVGDGYVLTAAHCVEGDYPRVDAFGGGWKAHDYRAAVFSTHQGGAGRGDLALIALDGVPENASTLRLAALSEYADIKSGAELIVRGRCATAVNERGPYTTASDLMSAVVTVERIDPFYVEVTSLNVHRHDT